MAGAVSEETTDNIEAVRTTGRAETADEFI